MHAESVANATQDRRLRQGRPPCPSPCSSCAGLGRGLLTLWFAVTVTFLLLRLLPGDPALAVASTNMTEDQRAALLTQYGLDQPLPTQYVMYLGQLLQGNLGTSFTQSDPGHSTSWSSGIPWTLLLTGTAMLLTVVIGIPLGVLAATHTGRRSSTGPSRSVGVTGQSLFVPSVGILLLYLFGLQLGWLPIGGAVSRERLRDRVVRLGAHAPGPARGLA